MLRTSGRALDVLAAINAPVARWGRDAAAALLALMVALALAQILSRALFSHTLDWAEELARMMLVWSVFLVAPFAYRAGAYVSISAFAEALPRGLLVAVAVLVNLLVIWICGVLLVESQGLVRRGLTIVASSMPFRMAFVYAIVPASLGAMMLVGTEHVLRLVLAWGDPGGRDLLLAGLVPIVQQDDAAGHAGASTPSRD
jgi:TRAP-type C4-dicarboxylate transport system permease small subunit